MQKRQGFTLVELIVVLVILGILGAFAVPRFVDLQEEARNATLKGLKGSLHGAASMAHGKQLAQQKSENASVDVQGDTISMDYGYPAPNPGTAGSNGIESMIEDLSGFKNSTTCANNGVDDTNCMRFIPSGASNNASCNVEYSVNSTNLAVVVNGTDCN